MNKTIIIRNPSPDLIRFLDEWKKRQQETLKRVRNKYHKKIQ